jgi:hypothetical protein
LIFKERVKETLRINRTPVDSTQLRSIGYDATTSTLEVEFRKGGVYQYYGVPAETYRQLMAAQSIGTYVNSALRKGGFAYARVS